MVMDSVRPAANALVWIAPYHAYATTDSTGRYRLGVPGARVVDGSSVEITVGRPGLVGVARRIALTAGDTVVMDFPVKTWQPLEDLPCYHAMTGYPAGTTPRAADPTTLEKLCRATVLWNRRDPGALPAVP
jgi:hypothetical protein